MAPRAKKEAHTPCPEARAKAKALKAKEATLKADHCHKQRRPAHCPPSSSQDTVAVATVHIPAGEASLSIMLSLGAQTPAWAVEKTENKNTLVFVVDAKASTQQTQEAVRL